MEDRREIRSSRFLCVAAFSIVVSVGIVLAVRTVAVRMLHPSPRFEPLTIGAPVFDTLVCGILATVVFVNIVSSPSDVRRWRYVATGVLIVSFVPDVLVGGTQWLGATWPDAFALMVMHVVVWAVYMTLLPWLAFSVPPPDEDRRDNPMSIR